MIIFVEPNAAGSGIPETSAFLNGNEKLPRFPAFVMVLIGLFFFVLP